MSTLVSAPERHPAAPVTKPVFRSALWSATLVTASISVLAAFLLIAIHHLRDGYHLDIATGIYCALAQDVGHGHLYPDLTSGEVYGGTRYMPLPFLLHAAAAAATGEYLFSGKLLALVLALVLTGLVIQAMRWLDVPVALTLVLAVTVLASGPGFWAATTIRGDLLPVVLQLAALSIACRRTTTPRVVITALLCALAILAKMTAVWAGTAILLYYLIQDRPAAAVFSAAAGGALALALAVLHLATAGNMLENFAALSVAGVQGPASLLQAPVRLLRFMSNGGSAVSCLFPLAVLGCCLAARERRWTLYHSAFLVSVPILLVILADKGTVSNHLLDLVVLTVIVTGSLWSATAELRPVIVLMALWCLVSCATVTLARETREVLRARAAIDSRFPAKPVAVLVGDDESLLADDPWVAVARGQRPVILDPYSLARAVEADPAAADGLIRRIAAREFAKIVLTDYAPDPGDDPYNYYLGPQVQQAIRTHYRLWARSEGYKVYVAVGD